jgi:hypothetical protein
MIWATVRSEMMKETYKIWLDKAVNPENIKFKFAVNTEEQRKELSEFEDVIITNQKHIGTVYPTYLMTTSLNINDDDIVIMASDDFYPPQGWDEYLINKLKGKCGCYFVNDGYQAPGNDSIKTSITIPIMTFSCLKQLNQMLYSLDYFHYYGDTELYNNLNDLGLLIDERRTEEMTFEHKNCVQHKRASDEYDAKYHAHVYFDRETFNRRMQMSVYERIQPTKGVWN